MCSLIVTAEAEFIRAPSIHPRKIYEVRRATGFFVILVPLKTLDKEISELSSEIEVKQYKCQGYNTKNVFD